MMNSEIYAEEMNDSIDLAIEDAEWEDAYGDFLEDSWSDAEADADALAGIGWGTDEDYGFYGE